MALLRSIRFNVALFCALIAASAVGTFVPQAADAPEKVQKLLAAYPAVGRALDAFGLFQVFHNWWFLFLLTLMALDTAVCRAWKFPGRGRKEPLDGFVEAIRSKPLTARLQVGTSSETIARARALLAREGYEVRPVPADAGAPAEDAARAVAASRHGLQGWGSPVSHAALVVILVGGLVKLLFGFQEYVLIPEGGSAPVEHKPGWVVAVDRFRVEYHEGTDTPRLFSTRLRVLEGGRPLAEASVEVNHPLKLGLLGIYQADWGASSRLRGAVLRLRGRELHLLPDRPLQVPGEGVRLTLGRFAPDFAVGPDRRVRTASSLPCNPALQVRLEPRSGPARTLWLAAERPVSAFLEDADGLLREVPPPSFEVAAVDPVLVSGLQVVHDPGYPLVLAGSAAWLVGMVLLMYLHHRKVWVLADPGGEREAGLLVGGWSSRGKVAFEREFYRLVEEIREVSA